ncbi:MAG TPA: cytochrome c oxidase assembly protein [Candidatus Angelobacter sp.]
MKLNSTLRIVCVFALLPSMAQAYEAADHVSPGGLWRAWSFEPWVIGGLLLTAALYIAGLQQSKQSSWQRASFAAGMIALALTLLSPIHRLGSELFSAHMTQHELLMLIAAPLLVLGKPGGTMLWGLPGDLRKQVARSLKLSLVAKSWKVISAPLAAWLIHGVTLWLWHVPVLYQATLDSEPVHAAQHATFLFTALLFWWTLFHGRGGRMPYGAAVAYVFTTAVHTSVLGALLTCSSKLWYPAYIERTAAWGLSPLEDQQLGGLIMWVPAGVVYLVIGLWLFAGWLRESDRRLVYARSTDLLQSALREGGRDA